MNFYELLLYDTTGEDPAAETRRKRAKCKRVCAQPFSGAARLARLVHGALEGKPTDTFSKLEGHAALLARLCGNPYLLDLH